MRTCIVLWREFPPEQSWIAFINVLPSCLIMLLIRVHFLEANYIHLNA